MTFPANLPDDIDAPKVIILASQTKMASLSVKKTTLFGWKSCWPTLITRSYGAKSEKANPDQYHLALEDIETAIAFAHAEDEAIDPPKTAESKSRAGRGVLPKHLPCVEEVIAPEDITCSCGVMRPIIGEDGSERLDIVPAQFRVLATHRHKYACSACLTSAPMGSNSRIC